jgi:hypothetical protein
MCRASYVLVTRCTQHITMNRYLWGRASLLLAASAIEACGVYERIDGADDAREVGDVALGLVLPDGSEVSSVDYVVTRSGVAIRSGAMLVGPDGRASVSIGGLDIGSGYHVKLSAGRDAGAACEGEADFAIAPSEVVQVAVLLQCAEATVDGNVTIAGTFNLCPTVTSTSTTPTSVAVGDNAMLLVAVRDRDGDALMYAWSALDGTFSAPTATSTLYKCASPGTKTLRFDVSDGPQRGCTRSASVTLTCVQANDGGLDAGRDAASMGDGAISCTPPISQRVVNATRSPDGAGWCCPASSPTCDCAFVGAFVADRCSCDQAQQGASMCDVPPPDWLATTDPHGCTVYKPRFPSNLCCNCPP